MAKASNESKTKRTARTIDEQIAELQAKKQERNDKAKAKASKDFDTLVEKRARAQAQVVKFDEQLRSLAAVHGFDLPAGVTPPSQQEIDVAQVAAAEDAPETDEV